MVYLFVAKGGEKGNKTRSTEWSGRNINYCMHPKKSDTFNY